MRLSLLCLTLAFLILQTTACRCTERATVCSEFTNKYVSRIIRAEVLSFNPMSGRYSVRVITKYKGCPMPNFMTVNTYLGNSCGFSLRVGVEYLLMLDKRNGSYLCNYRSQWSQVSSQDKALLSCKQDCSPNFCPCL